jgi:serine/threonine protein kinase
VADFGLSKLMKGHQHFMRTVCGTWAYCAPEVISRKPYTQAVDAWTLGVLMFILYVHHWTDCVPFFH